MCRFWSFQNWKEHTKRNRNEKFLERKTPKTNTINEENILKNSVKFVRKVSGEKFYFLQDFKKQFFREGSKKSEWNFN